MVEGLVFDEFVQEDPPCTPAAYSRWKPVDDCSGAVSGNTAATFSQVLSWHDDGNPYALNVYFPGEDEYACEASDASSFGFKVLREDGQCFQNIHPDEFSVFDFTDWVDEHPGMPFPIQQFATSGNFVLTYPSNSHGMDRWYGLDGNNSPDYRVELGMFGDVVPFEYFEFLGGVDSVVDTDGPVIVCGSADEVANVPELYGGYVRGGFDVVLPSNFTGDLETVSHQRELVWVHLALTAQDSLRQRVAWALSQILAISPSSLSEPDETEAYLVSAMTPERI